MNQHLNYYQNFFRPALFKIIFLKLYEGLREGKPVMENQMRAAEKEMFAMVKEFEAFLQTGGTDFVAGDRLTIADLQFYFELTNFTYYEKSFADYKLTTSWFNRVGEVPEVKAIGE